MENVIQQIALEGESKMTYSKLQKGFTIKITLSRRFRP